MPLGCDFEPGTLNFEPTCMTVFESRRDKLRQLLTQNSLEALLVTDERNVTYLTGFTGDSSYLLVAAKRHGAVASCC